MEWENYLVKLKSYKDFHDSDFIDDLLNESIDILIGIQRRSGVLVKVNRATLVW